jgi:DNA repair protein RadC
VKELEEIVGSDKAAIVAAALAFPLRRIHPRGFRISSTTDVLPLIQHMSAQKQKHLVCISINGANGVIQIRSALIGQARIHPGKVFAGPVTDRATAVIVARNHASGDATPSEYDRKLTRELEAAGKLLGIQLLDCIIFSQRGHYSFLENGEL